MPSVEPPLGAGPFDTNNPAWREWLYAVQQQFGGSGEEGDGTLTNEELTSLIYGFFSLPKRVQLALNGVANLEDLLLEDEMADTLHRHSELSGSDGTPNPKLVVNEDGILGIQTGTFQSWDTTDLEVMQLRDDLAIWSIDDQIVGFAAGMYYDGSDWRYSQTGKGAVIADVNIQTTEGNWVVHAVPNGIAGNVIAITDWSSLFFNSDGFFGINSIGDNNIPTAPLHIRADQPIFIKFDRTGNAGIDDVGVIGITTVTGTTDDYMYIGTDALPIMAFTLDDLYVGIGTVTPKAQLHTTEGRIVNSDRVTANTTLDVTNHNVFCDTDGGAFTATLPAGVDGTYYRIMNTGTSSNNLVIAPDGAENLLGDNSGFTLMDGESLIITYETTEGWY